MSQAEWLKAQTACLDMIERLKSKNLQLQEEVEQQRYLSEQSCEKFLCAREKLSEGAQFCLAVASAMQPVHLLPYLHSWQQQHIKCKDALALNAAAIMKQQLADLRLQNKDLQDRLDIARVQPMAPSCESSDAKVAFPPMSRPFVYSGKLDAVPLGTPADVPEPRNQRCNYSFILLLTLFLLLLAAVVYFRAQLQGLFINAEGCKMYADRLKTSERWDTCYAKVNTATYKWLRDLRFINVAN